MTLIRKRIPANVMSRLDHFYKGRRCVITGELANTEWHHLNDNPSHSTFANLIPLSRDWNLRLRQYAITENAIEPLPAVDPYVCPESLLINNRRHFMMGAASHAYACARQATWLNILYPAVFSRRHVVTSIIASLSAARHAASPDIIIDVLKRDLLGTEICSKLPAVDEARIVYELGCILQDYNCFRAADAIFERVSRNIRFLPASARSELKAKLLRRQSLTRIAAGDNLSEVAALVAEANIACEVKASGAYSSDLVISCANLKAWHYFACGQTTAAYDQLEPIISHVIRSDGTSNIFLAHPWNIVESLLTSYTAALVIEKGARKTRVVKKAYEHLRRVSIFAHRQGIQLRPVALELSISCENVNVPMSVECYMRTVQPHKDELSAPLQSTVLEVVRLLDSKSARRSVWEMPN